MAFPAQSSKNPSTTPPPNQHGHHDWQRLGGGKGLFDLYFHIRVYHWGKPRQEAEQRPWRCAAHWIVFCYLLKHLHIQPRPIRSETAPLTIKKMPIGSLMKAVPQLKCLFPGNSNVYHIDRNWQAPLLCWINHQCGQDRLSALFWGDVWIEGPCAQEHNFVRMRTFHAVHSKLQMPWFGLLILKQEFTISLCNWGWPQTHSSPASASQPLGFWAYTTITWCQNLSKRHENLQIA